MNPFYKIMLVFVALFPLTLLATPINGLTNKNLIAVVAQDALILDQHHVQSASLYKDEQGIYRGLHVILKKQAAQSFSKMTAAGIGKEMLLLFQNKLLNVALIKSEVKGDILISGINQKEAAQFINLLNLAEGKPLVRPYESSGILG